MPAHVDDRIDVLDHHRAFLDAGAARGARPQGFGIDQTVDDRLVRIAAMLADWFARIRAAGELSVSAAGEADDHVLNQFFRVQRLAGGEGRARCFALAALHAGVETEQLVPGEILGFFHAQRRIGIVQVQRFQTGRAPAAETFRATVPGQVQRTGKGVLHRPAPGHAEEQLRHAPQHTNTEDGGEHPTAEVFRQDSRHRQGHQEKRRGEGQQAFRQAHPRAFRQTRRRIDPAQVHEDRADEHHRRHQQQGVAKDAVMQAETVHKNGQHNRRHRTARRGDVGVGNVFVPRDDVVQVDHVALGHGQQTAEQIDLRRPPPAPHVHPPQRA